jgi:protein gp37
MSDLFQDAVPDEYISAVATIMLRANWHTYQVLTKRADRLHELLATRLSDAANARHIWWGVSVEDQKHGLPRLDRLRQTPARVRFLSIEPLLEDLGTIDLRGIDWAIVGGESGPGARPMEKAWVDQIRRQCEAQEVLFFFKQWGGVQKAKNGRLLHGRTYDAMPAQQTVAIPTKGLRDHLVHSLAPLTRAWPTAPLVHLVRSRRIA